MKSNNYLRLKIYVGIFIFSYMMGWIGYDSRTIMVLKTREIEEKIFGYSAFSVFLSTGYLITLLYDIIIYFKNKKTNN